MRRPLTGPDAAGVASDELSSALTPQAERARPATRTAEATLSEVRARTGDSFVWCERFVAHRCPVLADALSPLGAQTLLCSFCSRRAGPIGGARRHNQPVRRRWRVVAVGGCWPGARWTLAGRMLAMQLAIVCVVLVGVAAVSLAQSDARFRDTEGRRALAVAESLAVTRRRPRGRRASRRSRLPRPGPVRRRVGPHLLGLDDGRSSRCETAGSSPRPTRCRTDRASTCRTTAAFDGRSLGGQRGGHRRGAWRWRRSSTSTTRETDGVVAVGRALPVRPGQPRGRAAEPADLPRHRQPARRRSARCCWHGGSSARPSASSRARSPASSSSARPCCTASRRACSPSTSTGGSPWSTTRPRTCSASP